MACVLRCLRFTLTGEFACSVFECDLLGKLLRHQAQLLEGKKDLFSLSSLEDFQCMHHQGLFLIACVQQIPLGFGRLPRLWCAAVFIRRGRVCDMPFTPSADTSSFYWLVSGRGEKKCLQQHWGVPERCCLVSKKQHREDFCWFQSMLHRAFFWI